jgi:succinate dehydrogenase / fumarate reductase cytochrome b subunit
MSTNTTCSSHAAPVAAGLSPGSSPGTSPGTSLNASPTAYNHPLLTAIVAEAKPACKCGKLRPPRKLHAAVGLWLALFVCLHFSICLTGIHPAGYNAAVASLHRSLAHLPGAVLLLVLLPMLLQAGSGLYLLAKEGVSYNVKRCDRGGKLRYAIQRWSGIAMLAFLLPHVAAMRGWGTTSWGKTALGFLDHSAAAHPLASAAALPTSFEYTAAALHPWSLTAFDSLTTGFLLFGVLLTVYHIANGAWTGSILWKIVQTDNGKARMGYLTASAGVVLLAMGLLAWYAFSLSPNIHPVLASR